MGEYEFQPMKLEDVTEAHDIEAEATSFPWSKGVFYDSLQAGHECWVARGNQEILGHIVLSVAAGESHILTICVKKLFQRHGLGRALLLHGLECARLKGADVAFLEVRESNVGAYHLYQKEGFNEVGRRVGYYPAVSGREDALILACGL